MAMKLSIVPDKRAYWPGDVVGLVVEVGCLHSQAFYNKNSHMSPGKNQHLSSSYHCSQHAVKETLRRVLQLPLQYLLQVITEPVLGAAQAAATQLASLELECSGTERVDLTWVSSSYQARRIGVLDVPC